MKIKNYVAASSVAAVLAVTGAVTAPVWAGDDHDEDCVASATSKSNPYCPDDTESPYPTETGSPSPTETETPYPTETETPYPTETPTTPTPTTPTPTTPTPTTPVPTTPVPTTPVPTTPVPTTPVPTTPVPTTAAPTTAAPTTTTPTTTPTTTVSPSTGATNAPGGGGGGAEVEVLGQQASTGPVVQQAPVPTTINAGLTEERSDGTLALPLGLAALGGLMGLVALVLRRRHA